MSDINRRLDDHETRINNLEKLTSQANADIQVLKKLIEAQANKLAIISYTQTPEGYVLNMSDGTTITLKNGKDGHSPAIGTKMENGVLYWTINGNFMLDEQGNKIKVEGQDGANGFTPMLRVDKDGCWEVSLDNGKSWEALLDESGNKVKAVGVDGSSDFSISEDEYSYTIIYKGEKFVIPKEGKTPPPVARPKLAIEYIALTNLTGTPGGEIKFVSSPYEYGWYYIWNDAVSLNYPEGWHLPTLEEWRGILPDYGYIKFSSTLDNLDISETASVGGEIVNFTSDYRSTGGDSAYAIRYKNEKNDMLSAWLYEYFTIPDGEPNSGTFALKITVRYLGPDQKDVTIDTISDNAWWSSDNSGDIVRIFPAIGFRNEKGTSGEVGTYTIGKGGNYWSITENPNDSSKAFRMVFIGAAAYTGYALFKEDGYAVRPFADTL